MSNINYKSNRVNESGAIEKIPECKATLVTPQMAKEWLDNSKVINRSQSDLYISGISQDINNGGYDTPAQQSDIICLDKNNGIVNGHHRLLAIYESGMPVYVYVKHDSEPSRHMDTGRKRSIADNYRMFKNSTISAHYIRNASAMLRAMIISDRNNAWAFKGKPKESILFDLIDYSMPDILDMQNGTRFLTTSDFRAGTNAAIFVAYLNGVLTSADILHIENVYTTFITDNPIKDSAILRLYRVQHSNGNLAGGGSGLAISDYLKSQDALYKYAEGINAMQLRESRHYPIPKRYADKITELFCGG